MTYGRARAIFRGGLVLAALAALGACSRPAMTTAEGESATPGGTAPLRLAMVTDVGGLGDKSFNDSAYAGLQQAKARLGADVQVLQSKSAADYQPNLTVLADQDEDEIFAVGFLMSKDLDQVARTYPRRHFAIVDAVSSQPNVASMTFREQDGSFLAGALAAMVTKTKTIGFLGGVDIPLLRKFEAGFTAGAHQIDPSVKVLVKYVGSFEDVASGKELAGVMYDGGADIVFVAAGKSGLGAIDETRARPNVYAIGVDADQDALAPGKILTSMVKHVDVAVFKIAQEAHGLKTPAGNVEFGLRDGGVGLTDFKYTRAAIGSAHIARLATIRDAIVAGRIVPPATREALATFKPAKL
ncbi:MAG: BMP family ABC transporter substrate-binding protein [Candidatus Eremiobacteraeota bacterium]|nr:BMP family ABC transporter substrate-binding protein [Candidatus Eremiobacteraeota bacterium]